MQNTQYVQVISSRSAVLQALMVSTRENKLLYTEHQFLHSLRPPFSALGSLWITLFKFNYIMTYAMCHISARR